MKRSSITIALAILLLKTSAQNHFLFLRHDTSVLKASECNWLIPPVPAQTKSANTNPVTLSNPQNTVSEWFLSSIHKGKLKALDPYSEKPIPARQIYHWGMSADTVALYDANLEKVSYKIVVKEIQPENLDQVRIQQDWWLDPTTGKIFSRIRWIELMLEMHSSSGDFIAYRPFCRIYY